jgi:hypothetical protein
VDAGHGACINAPHLFAAALLEACWSVEPGRVGTLHTSLMRPARVQHPETGGVLR